METVQWETLPAEVQALVTAAQEATAAAYAPYSRFRVGAAFRLEDETIITGANYESASYGLTCCAERISLFQVQQQGKVPHITAMAVTAQPEMADATQASVPVPPCGACRQVLFEASDRIGRDFPIYAASPDGTKVMLTSAHELLPAGFGPANLGM